MLWFPGTRPVCIVADVTDPAAIEAGVKAAEAARGPFDILVANAGGV